MASNYVEILVRARDQGAKPEMDDLRVKLNDLAGKVAEARAVVDDSAAAAKLDDLQAKLLRLDRTTARPRITMDQAVRAESQLHSLDAAFAKIGDDAEQSAAKADKALDDVGRKAKDTGQQTASAISPLLIGAFAAAATAGPGLLLAGTAAAVLGAGALITKSNANLQDGYRQLGQDASQAVTEATAPLVPALQGALGVLDQGIGQTGDELKGAFAAVAPDAKEIAGGLVSLVDNALPGLTTGLKAIAPYSHEIAVDFGKLGSGAGGLFAGLAGGAGGGMQGLSALIDAASHLLTDVGQITGALANGLGPALHDIDTVAVPVAGALTDVVDAIPPGMVRGAADAVAALFAAFQVGKIAGVVGEGQSFLQWIGVAKTESKAAAVEVGALGAAEEATAVKTGLASKALGGLGAAASVAVGPLGAIVAGAGMLGDVLGKNGVFGLADGKVGASLVGSVSQMAGVMQDAAAGAGAAQDQVTQLAQAVAAAPFGIGAKTLGDMDAALTQLQADSPQQAATEFYQIGQALEAQGKSAAQVTALFPQYTRALADAKTAAGGLAGATAAATAEGTFTTAIKAQVGGLGDCADKSATATLAALGLTDGQAKLTTGLYGTLIGFDSAQAGAQGYEAALQALNGTTASLDDAQNSMAQDLLNLRTQFNRNGDTLNLNTQAGINNRDALSAAAKAANQLAGAQYQATGNMGKANQTLKDQENAILNATGATGKARDAIKAYLDQILKVPTDVTTNVHADVSPAIKAVQDAIHTIDGSSAYIQVYANPVGPGGGKAYLPDAHGGIIGGIGAAATGGAHGSLTMIDEEGPEIVRLPSGSMVMSHPDTMREIGRRQDGASPSVVVEFAPTGAEDLFIRALRQAIRVRGGNVQAVLGHG